TRIRVTEIEPGLTLVPSIPPLVRARFVPVGERRRDAAQGTPPLRQAARKNATLRATSGSTSARRSLSFSPNKARARIGQTTKSRKNLAVVASRGGVNAGKASSVSDWAASAR